MFGLRTSWLYFSHTLLGLCAPFNLENAESIKHLMHLQSTWPVKVFSFQKGKREELSYGFPPAINKEQQHF